MLQSGDDELGKRVETRTDASQQRIVGPLERAKVARHCARRHHWYVPVSHLHTRRSIDHMEQYQSPPHPDYIVPIRIPIPACLSVFCYNFCPPPHPQITSLGFAY